MSFMDAYLCHIKPSCSYPTTHYIVNPDQTIYYFRHSNTRRYPTYRKDEPAAIGVFAYKIVQEILNRIKSDRSLAIHIRFKPLQLKIKHEPEERGITEASFDTRYHDSLGKHHAKACELAEKGIEVAKRCLGMGWGGISLDNYNPSSVSIEISASRIEEIINTIEPRIPQEMPLSLESAQADDLTVLTHSEPIRCRRHILLVRSATFKRYFAFQQLPDTLNLAAYSYRAVKAFIDHVYQRQVEAPSNVEDAKALITLSHEFEFPYLKYVGVLFLTSHVFSTSALFFELTTFAITYRLDAFIRYCNAKLDVDSGYKRSIQVAFSDVVTLIKMQEQPRQALDLAMKNLTNFAKTFRCTLPEPAQRDFAPDATLRQEASLFY